MSDFILKYDENGPYLQDVRTGCHVVGLQTIWVEHSRAFSVGEFKAIFIIDGRQRIIQSSGWRDE